MTQDGFHKQHTEPTALERNKMPALPEKIGPYKIETLLSEGSSSRLYMGIDPVSKIPVVIKVLPSDLLNNKESLERFLKESKLTSLASHPGVVKLYKEGDWEGGLYIAMEWIRGVSLRQFLTGQSFSLKRSLEIILQICRALKHLHDSKIVHRDLKPENVLITEEGTVKLIDFGIAQMVNDEPLLISSKIVGTPSYMSPEQKKNPNEVNYASDIYSLGVLAYELILGKLSYGVIHTSLLPSELRKIINKMLAVSVNKRYQSVDALIADLSAYLGSGEIDKEKPDQDKSTELLEVFQKNAGSLSSFTKALGPHADIGMAKMKCPSMFGLYHDLFTFSDGSILIIIADPKEQGLDPLFAAAGLRGIVHTLVTELSKNPLHPFETASFIQALQRQMERDPLVTDFALSYLYLNPAQSTLHFYNAGLSHLIYTPAGEASKILYNAHPLLSQGNSDLSETVEKWNAGDVILFHNLISEEKDPPEKKEALENKLLKTLREHMFLSAGAQADAIAKELSSTSFFSPSEQTKVLFSIQRVV